MCLFKVCLKFLRLGALLSFNLGPSPKNFQVAKLWCGHNEINRPNFPTQKFYNCGFNFKLEISAEVERCKARGAALDWLGARRPKSKRVLP